MKILLIMVLSLLSLQAVAQDYFIKEYHLDGREAYGAAIDNYGDQYIIAGTRWSYGTTYSIFMGLLDEQGNILQYDTVPEVEFLITVNRNNDFNSIGNESFYYNSVGSGRTLVYRYDLPSNDLNVIDTLHTSLNNFSTMDFITRKDDEHIFVGINRDLDDLTNMALYKVSGDSIRNCVIRDTIQKVVPSRMFQNEDGTISVLCRQHPQKGTVTIAHYLFDAELNLLESSVGDTLLKRAEHTEAIKDSEGDFVFGSRLFLDSNFVSGSDIVPLISKFSHKEGILWDRQIGRVVNNRGINSGWFGLTESVEKDGYVAAGTMQINTQDSIKLLGALVKLSTEGDSIWYREYSTIDTSVAYTQFRDVVATSDGYMIIGDEQCFSEPPGCPRLSTLLIIRTDAQGRVEPDSSTSVITVDETGQLQLSAFPNPCADVVYLQHELRSSATYRLVDVQGRVKREAIAEAGLHTYRMEMSELVSGSYFLQLWIEGKKREELQLIKY